MASMNDIFVFVQQVRTESTKKFPDELMPLLTVARRPYKSIPQVDAVIAFLQRHCIYAMKMAVWLDECQSVMPGQPPQRPSDCCTIAIEAFSFTGFIQLKLCLSPILHMGFASFEQPNGRERRHVSCVWKRPGSNPGSWDTKRSALTTTLLARSPSLQRYENTCPPSSPHAGGAVSDAAAVIG